MSVSDILVLLLVLFITDRTIVFFSKGKGLKSRNILYYLWLYHLLFGCIFYIYISVNGGDALAYWQSTGIGLGEYIDRGQGTSFMFVFNYFFVEILQLSFFAGSLIYVFIGYLGIMFFYLSTVALVNTNVKVLNMKLFPWIFFLPNIHFWSSGVGKDTLSFFCIGLFLYSIMKPFNRSWGIGLSLLLVYFVRPHIAIFLLVSFGAGFMLDTNLNLYKKLLLSICLILGAAFIFNDVMEFLKLDELSTESVEQFSDQRVGLLSREHTGSSVDISSYPLPLKVFTFLFRPLFFDARSPMALLASIENLVLLILLSKVISKTSFKLLKKSPYQVKGLFFFFLLGTLSFSNILGNMGIMMRMKNMLMPGILIVLLWLLSTKKQIKLKRCHMLKQQVLMQQSSEGVPDSNTF